MNHFEPVADGKPILDDHAQGIAFAIPFGITNVLAAAGFRIATQIVLGIRIMVTLVEAIGVAAIGQAFQLANEQRVKAAAGLRIINRPAIGLAGTGHVVRRLGAAFDLERINTDFDQALHVFNGA